VTASFDDYRDAFPVKHLDAGQRQDYYIGCSADRTAIGGGCEIVSGSVHVTTFRPALPTEYPGYRKVTAVGDSPSGGDFHAGFECLNLSAW
jgi:hypothetical protein